MMKRVLLAAAAFSALAPAAFAADIASEPAPVAPAPSSSAFDWTGFFVGVHGGYAAGSADVAGAPGDVLDGVNGGAFGAQAGYDVQFGHAVIGAQTDFAWSGASETTDALPPSTEASLGWLGSTTARAGYAFDQLLVYGKAGVAYGQGTIDVAGVGKSDDWLVGWTAGAGLEYGFAPNLTGFLEYDHIDLGEAKYVGLGNAEVDWSTSLVKAGLNYKF